MKPPVPASTTAKQTPSRSHTNFRISKAPNEQCTLLFDPWRQARFRRKAVSEAIVGKRRDSVVSSGLRNDGASVPVVIPVVISAPVIIPVGVPSIPILKTLIALVTLQIAALFPLVVPKGPTIAVIITFLVLVLSQGVFFVALVVAPVAIVIVVTLAL